MPASVHSAARVLSAVLFCAAVLALLAAPGAVGTSRPRGGPEPTLSAPWFHPKWRYRVRITAAQNLLGGSGVLRDLPLLVGGANLVSVFPRARADGRDIVITKRDGVTVLPREIVGYDAVSHGAEIWFQADTLSSTVRDFYIYYGNPDTTIAGPGSVWNDDYAAVYHFDADPGLGVLPDYTSHHNNANAANAAAQWTSGDVTNGQIGQAWAYNGTTHFINTRAIRIPDSTYVISCWLKTTTRSTDFAFQSNPGFWHVSSQTNNIVQRPHYNLANPWRDLRWDPDPLPIDDSFHYFTWVFDGVADTILFYYDGTQQTATPWSVDPGVTHFYTGIPINPDGSSFVGIVGPMFWNSADLMNGPADEFRIGSGAHSSQWIRAEYNNQRDPGAFYQVSAQESSTPVHLLDWSAARTDAGIVLRWRVSDPSPDHRGFDVYRDTGAGARTRIGTAPFSGDPEFVFVDENPHPGDASYWLAEIASTRAWYGPLVVLAATPAGLLLRQNVPNPFAGFTTVSFATAAAGPVTLRVFDVRGREVRTLFDRDVPVGSYAATWDGRDAAGRRRSPGVYLMRLETLGGSLTRKLLLR